MKKHIYTILLFLIIIASSVLFFRNLGQPNLTMWDEVVHANVIKNLAQNCCAPILQKQSWGTDFHDWTNTTVWLHKPLLPFYISAVFYKIHPSTLAIRLPALICFELLLITVYFVGRRYFHPAVGLGAVTLMAFNIYSFQLVQGTQFSGFGDIGFALFVLLAVAFILEHFRNPRAQWVPLCSLSLMLAYFFKGGLALIPLGILGLAILVKRGQPARRSFNEVGEPFIAKLKNLCLAALVFIIPVGIVSLYLSKHFGVPYAYEQRMQLAHLWQNVEGWGRPWDWYLTIFGPNMVGAWLLPAFLFTLFWSLFNLKKHPDFAKATSGKKDLFIFSAIIFGFFISLSFAVSKVPNFIYATLPLIAILISGAVYRLWQNKNYKTIAMLAVSVCLMYILLRFDLWFIKEYLQRIVTITQRLLIIDVSAGVLAASAIIAVIGNKIWQPLTLKVLMVLAVVLVAWSNVHANLAGAKIPDPTSLYQQNIRLDAAKLSTSAPANSAIIIDMPELYRSNLYFEFWSNLPAVEVDPARTIRYWLNQIPPNRPVFLINETNISRIR